jgi:hypothetical protein
MIDKGEFAEPSLLDNRRTFTSNKTVVYDPEMFTDIKLVYPYTSMREII